MLDGRSRQVLLEFIVQTSVGASLMLALFALGGQTWLDLGHAGARVLMFYSLVDCLRAAVWREPMGRGSLNRWDQALAFSAGAFLLHAVVQ